MMNVKQEAVDINFLSFQLTLRGSLTQVYRLQGGLSNY